MDNKLQNNTWDNILDLAAMEEHQILHNPSPFDSLWPSNYNPFQLAHQIPSSSTPNPNLLDDQRRVLDNMEDQDLEEPEEELGAMKEMMYKIAAMQPVDIDPATIRKPKRRNVRISEDPQSVAARHRRERISEKIRILQRLVPGGTKMDTASMLDEAIRYVKFLKRQIRQLQSPPPPPSVGVLTGDRNWPVAPPNKASSLAQPPPAGFPFGAEPLCFNHEVISD